MSSRRTAMGVAVWAAVVLVGSTLVWGVISRVGAEASHQMSAAQPTLASTPELTHRPRPRPTPTQPSDRRSSSAEESGSDGRAGDEPGDDSEDGPSSPGTPSTGEGGGTSSGAVASTTDTWSGSPGTVRATCRGTELVDWSASPDPGWKLETEQEGELHAHFERGDDDDGEVEVTVTCTAAGPRFRVEG